VNPLTISQERIQGLVWLISLIGCYVSAWCLFAYRKKITGDGDAAGIRFALVVGATMLTLTGSCTWYYMGAEIIGRLVHPALFVVVEKHR
jgi:hypothetical protein